MAEQSPSDVIHAVAAIQFVAGAPSFLWQDGSFAAAIQDNGVGNITVSLVQDRAIDDTEAGYLITSRDVAQPDTSGTVAGSGAGPNADVDRDKLIQISNAQIPVAADVDFSLCIFKAASPPV